MKTIINFSANRDANCIKIADQIAKFYKDEGVNVFNFYETSLSPCGNCEYECIKQNVSCKIDDKLNEMYESVSNSTEAIYIMPNYNDYPCANFFIFNERGNGYFNKDGLKRKKYQSVKKKFIVISNSHDENFKKAFSYHVEKEPKILFLGAKKLGFNSLDKNLVDKEGVRKLIKNFILEKYCLEHSAMAVVIHKNNILCTSEEIYGNISVSLPKGHIEKGETVLEAAIRECYEETNVEIKKENMVEMLEPYEVNFTNHYFDIVKKIIYPVLFVVNEQGNPKSKEDKISNVEFMNIGRFMACCSYQNVVNLVQEVILKLTRKIDKKNVVK